MITFAPSNMPNGIKLKNAKYPFIMNPNVHVIEVKLAPAVAGFIAVFIEFITKNINASKMFTTGPHRDMIPFSSLFMFP